MKKARKPRNQLQYADCFGCLLKPDVAKATAFTELRRLLLKSLDNSEKVRIVEAASLLTNAQCIVCTSSPGVKNKINSMLVDRSESFLTIQNASGYSRQDIIDHFNLDLRRVLRGDHVTATAIRKMLRAGGPNATPEKQLLWVMHSLDLLKAVALEEALNGHGLSLPALEFYLKILVEIRTTAILRAKADNLRYGPHVEFPLKKKSRFQMAAVKRGELEELLPDDHWDKLEAAEKRRKEANKDGYYGNPTRSASAESEETAGGGSGEGNGPGTED